MKKFTAILLAVVMVFALGASAFAADTTPVTTKAVDTTLSVTVDYTIEGLYFDGTTLKSSATNGYYPFNFSFIVSDRTAVGSITVSNGGSFAWASDSEDSETESTTTTYGLVTLPTTSASTVTVTSKSGGTLTISCAQPNGGTTAAGTALYAYLPAPAQFVNEGVTTGGWGDAYDSTGTTLKGTSATGVSLGFFGGYAVYEFENPIADDPTHPYGADFIVYGNAFWNNSEAGCIQVSQGPDDNGNWEWYDIAGSMYYTKSTPNASIKFTNPNPNEDKGITTAGATSTLADVSYDLTVNGTTTPGTVTKNTFHNHSWFPLNVNYFVDYVTTETTRKQMAKVDEFSFVSRTLASNGVTDKLTFTGTLLTDYPGTGKTDQIGFGYCDVHPNKTLGGTIAYNPYQTFTSSSDYDTKVAGTSGGDPIDIAWAVKSNGTPANLDSIRYVRIYTGMAQMNGIFGEISTEVCGVAACTGTGTGAAGKTLTIKKDLTSYKPESGWSKSLTPGAWTIKSSASNVYINGTRIDASSGYSLTVESGKTYQIITQNGTEAPIVSVVTCA